KPPLQPPHPCDLDVDAADVHAAAEGDAVRLELRVARQGRKEGLPRDVDGLARGRPGRATQQEGERQPERERRRALPSCICGFPGSQARHPRIPRERAAETRTAAFDDEGRLHAAPRQCSCPVYGARTPGPTRAGARTAGTRACPWRWRTWS